MINEYFYKDPSTLSKTLLVLLVFGGIVDSVAVHSDGMANDLLVSMRNGAEITEEEKLASDSRQHTIGILQSSLFLITAVFFLSWVHRMSQNAHSIEDADLEYTPGWAVGYFFIPIYNLWKPYKALKEAYDAFAREACVRKNHLIFPLWWFAWIVGGIVCRMAGRLSPKGEGLDALIDQSSIAVALDVWSVLLDVTAFFLVMSVTGMCVRSFERSRIRAMQRS